MPCNTYGAFEISLNFVHSRFRQGGNAGDVTVQAGGTTYAAAFGDGDERDWRSTGQCFYQVR